jgi:hypothetical protein
MNDKELAETKAMCYRMIDVHRLAYEKAIAPYLERLARLRELEPPSPLCLPWEDARRVAAMVPPEVRRWQPHPMASEVEGPPSVFAPPGEVEAWESGEQPREGRQEQVFVGGRLPGRATAEEARLQAELTWLRSKVVTKPAPYAGEDRLWQEARGEGEGDGMD